MKTEPTETDREAARLFAPAPGMRAWCRIEGAEVVARFLRRDPVTMHAHAFAEGINMHLTETLAHDFDVVAIDTDDPATVGVMLAQVEAMTGEPADLWTHSRHTEVEYEVDMYNGATLGSGPTRGAALVAAMKALKSPA